MSNVFLLTPEGTITKQATYSLSPKEALRNFIKRTIKGNMEWWTYPKEVEGMKPTTFGWTWTAESGNIYSAYERQADMENFLKEIHKKYTLEDFTGYIGSLLDDGVADEATLLFLHEIYCLAVKELS